MKASGLSGVWTLEFMRVTLVIQILKGKMGMRFESISSFLFSLIVLAAGDK